jgi:hypothetical protein
MLMGKIIGRGMKDYVLFPPLSRTRWRRTLAANFTAKLLRNRWAYVVIFCGHFPDGAHKFTADVLKDENRTEWHLRQMLGAANFQSRSAVSLLERQSVLPDRAPPLPDLPSNWYAQIAALVRALGGKHDLPYNSRSLAPISFNATDSQQIGASRSIPACSLNRAGTRVGGHAPAVWFRILAGAERPEETDDVLCLDCTDWRLLSSHICTP